MSWYQRNHFNLVKLFIIIILLQQCNNYFNMYYNCNYFKCLNFICFFKNFDNFQKKIYSIWLYEDVVVTYVIILFFLNLVISFLYFFINFRRFGNFRVFVKTHFLVFMIAWVLWCVFFWVSSTYIFISEAEIIELYKSFYNLNSSEAKGSFLAYKKDLLLKTSEDFPIDWRNETKNYKYVKTLNFFSYFIGSGLITYGLVKSLKLFDIVLLIHN